MDQVLVDMTIMALQLVEEGVVPLVVLVALLILLVMNMVEDLLVVMEAVEELVVVIKPQVLVGLVVALDKVAAEAMANSPAEGGKATSRNAVSGHGNATEASPLH